MTKNIFQQFPANVSLSRIWSYQGFTREVALEEVLDTKSWISITWDPNCDLNQGVAR